MGFMGGFSGEGGVKCAVPTHWLATDQILAVRNPSLLFGAVVAAIVT